MLKKFNQKFLSKSRTNNQFKRYFIRKVNEIMHNSTK